MIYSTPGPAVGSQRREERGPWARRKREVEALRHRILDAAEEILIEEGYESLSMRRIADAIEYAPSSLYGYFRDKKAILTAVMERTTGQLVEALERAAMTPGPLTRLRMLGRAYVEFGLNFPRHYEVLFMLRGRTIPVLDSPAFEAAAAHFRQAVVDGVKTGAFRRCHPDETAQAFWAACHGLVCLLLTHSDRFDFVPADRLLEGALTLQLEGLRPQQFGFSARPPQPVEPARNGGHVGSDEAEAESEPHDPEATPTREAEEERSDPGPWDEPDDSAAEPEP